MLKLKTLSSSLPRNVSTSSCAQAAIDGGTLEGGGQLLRNAVALSALLANPISITKIRESRKPPGLRPQHAAGLQLISTICKASTEGIDKGSRFIRFNPASIHAGEYTADPGTAGSTTLLFQVSLPVLLFSRPPENTDISAKLTSTSVSKLILRGGTNALNAPPIDYTIHVFLPFMTKHFGLSAESLNVSVKRRGCYPRGGGELEAIIPALLKGTSLPPLRLSTRGAITKIHGKAYVFGSLPSDLSNQMRTGAYNALQHLIPPEMTMEDRLAFIDISTESDKGTRGGSPGSGIILWAVTEGGCIIGASALGRKGDLATETGASAANNLLRNLDHGGCVDEYLQDQIILFMALAKGVSTVIVGPLTLHTKTAIWIVEQLTDAKFEIVAVEGVKDVSLLTCRGIGLEGQA